MRDWRIILLLCFLFCFPLVSHEQDLLKLSDVNRIMHQILSKHLESQEISSKIVQSALITYIEQFDPQHLYLLQEEVNPYLSLSPDQISQVMNEYGNNNFNYFKQLNQVIQQSIERARGLQEIQRQGEQLFRNNPPSSNEKDSAPFANNVEQLKQRWRQDLYENIQTQKKRSGENLTPAQQQRVLGAYEMTLREAESKYLYQDEKGEPLPPQEQENLFAIHILKALANSLDSHTNFYMAKEAYDMRVRLQKEFRGIGVILKDTVDGPTITHLLEGGPAATSGKIKVGDILIKVDGQSVESMSFEEVMALIHGEKNDEIELTFKRQASQGQAEQTYSVKLVLEEIIINNDRVDISSQPFGNGIIGIITLHSFYQGDDISSEKDVRDAID